MIHNPGFKGVEFDPFKSQAGFKTLECLGIWERLYNPRGNYGEFATIRNQMGLNIFKINAKEYVENEYYRYFCLLIKIIPYNEYTD